MAFRLIVTPEVETDLNQAVQWYEARKPGLGAKFLANVTATVEEIVRMPEIHRTVERQYRRGLVKRFPYAVFYDLVGDTITIFGVFHTSRDPSRWQRRLP